MERMVEMPLCPGCGKRPLQGQKECEYCGREIIITTFNTVESMSLPEVNKYAGSYRKALAENPGSMELNNAIAMCYLKLKLYDKAVEAFEKAVVDNFDNSETFFYAGVSLLRGKKPFLASRSDINKIEDYLNAAIMIEPRGIYYYFWALIRYDHHFRKAYRVSPDYKQLLGEAKRNGCSDYDIAALFNLLGIQKPAGF